MVGRDHDIHHWKTPDPRPIVTDFDREYNPGDLFDSEKWIVPLVEPMRLTYMVKPVPLRIMLPEKKIPDTASTATLVALHPQTQGAFKEIIVFRHECVCKVYNLLSHGRRIYRCLEYTSF